ncbi:MAG: P-loop NTPase [Halapricum sp.]
MSGEQVYAVVGAKGGVGKTTTSINLGTALAEMGVETVTVELDLAMANLVDFLDIAADSESTTFHDVLAGRASVEAATYETESGLAVVPSGTDLDGYANTDLDRLPAVVQTLRWAFDVVLLDTPAGLSEETIRPLQQSDSAIVVSTPRVSSVRNAENTIQLADRTDTPVKGLLLTKSGTGASPGADRIAEFLDLDLLGHVPEDDAVPHSQDHGRPVVVEAPQSGAAIAYRKIARILRGSDAESISPAMPADATKAGGARATVDDEPQPTNDEPKPVDDESQAVRADGHLSTIAERRSDGATATQISRRVREMDRTRPEPAGDPLQSDADDNGVEASSPTNAERADKETAAEQSEDGERSDTSPDVERTAESAVDAAAQSTTDDETDRNWTDRDTAVEDKTDDSSPNTGGESGRKRGETDADEASAEREQEASEQEAPKQEASEEDDDPSLGARVRSLFGL